MICANFTPSRGCGIEDEGTLIITGGGSNGRSDSVATKIVDRYNRQVYPFLSL